ncbi:glycosyl transferase [Aureimonas sp. SA4125]|uniref:glycosyltransferase n=1 Tax=Aureimonas sp. SA4125 TaxID=2826993 RepID=UPI001CC41DF2|nr:glycosyltransferase family 4 protein [Aureimonas sp. SA4125]BDA82761.1 glycosyl transferase [Aureimonas sp. SA4125]
MHLLFISSLLPDGDAASGFELANRAIVDEYRRQGVRLTLAGFRRPGSRPAGEDEIDLGEMAIENAAVGGRRKLAWLARAFSAGLPVSAAKLAVLDPTVLRAKLARAGEVDGYVLNSIQMPTAYPFLSAERPSIFIAHNVEHLSAEENARNARSPAARFLYRREARLLAVAERRICRRAAVIHTLSREDQRLLGLAQNPSCHPLALSIGRPTLPDAGCRTHDIGLIGTWSWAPNRVGLDWFVEKVVPLLPDDLRIAIAGRFDGPPPAAPANVRFVGRVADAQAFIQASHVVALATRGGTGVQLKTIETFEEGMPAVATPGALRGVDHVPENVRVADDSKGFAAALVQMVADAQAGRVRRGNGFAFMLGQRHALSAAIRQGLADLTPLLAHEAAGQARSGALAGRIGDAVVPPGVARG